MARKNETHTQAIERKIKELRALQAEITQRIAEAEADNVNGRTNWGDMGDLSHLASTLREGLGYED